MYRGKVREVVVQTCRENGFEPRIICETQEIQTLHGLVAAGLGVAVLPASATLRAPAETRSIPLGSPRIERTVAVLSKQGESISNTAAAFINIARGCV